MTREEALKLARKGFDGLDEDEIDELQALINSHFEMVEKLRKHSKDLDTEISELINENFWELD